MSNNVNRVFICTVLFFTYEFQQIKLIAFLMRPIALIDILKRIHVNVKSYKRFLKIISSVTRKKVTIMLYDIESGRVLGKSCILVDCISRQSAALKGSAGADPRSLHRVQSRCAILKKSHRLLVGCSSGISGM